MFQVLFFFLILNLRRSHREAKISTVTLGTIIQPFNNLTFETSGKGRLLLALEQLGCSCENSLLWGLLRRLSRLRALAACAEGPDLPSAPTELTAFRNSSFRGSNAIHEIKIKVLFFK